jgi:hypothetical protein
MGVVGYIMGSPARKRALKAKEMAERQMHEHLNTQVPDKENSK